jgi:RimJ/RimL family protein N-acetyltransferase
LGISEKLIAPWISANQEEEVQSYTFAMKKVSLINSLVYLDLNWDIKVSKRRTLVQITFRSLKRYGTQLNRVLDFGFDDLNLHRIQAGVP